MLPISQELGERGCVLDLKFKVLILIRSQGIGQNSIQFYAIFMLVVIVPIVNVDTISHVTSVLRSCYPCTH